MCGKLPVPPQKIRPDPREDWGGDLPDRNLVDHLDYSMVPADIEHTLPLPNHNRCRTCNEKRSYDEIVIFKGRCKNCALGPPETREPYQRQPRSRPPVTYILGGPK